MHQVCTVWLITKHSWFVEFISFYMQFIPFNDKLQIGETKELSFMFCQTADRAFLALPVVAGSNFPLLRFDVFMFSLS